MRRVLYDRTGAPQLYLTGAGVLYTLRDKSVGQDEPVGFVQQERVVDRRGEGLGWFDGVFLWDVGGVLGFVKGARGGLELPPTQPLRVKPHPTPAPFYPLLKPQEKPPLRWAWSERTLADLIPARTL